MEQDEIIRQLNEIFVDIIDDDDIKLTKETTADDVEGWDSLTHIQLVVAIEKHFKVRFNSKEIQSWKNVGDLVDSIIAKI
jgi:acyl carrier protein